MPAPIPAPLAALSHHSYHIIQYMYLSHQPKLPAKSDLKTKGISYNNCALLAGLALRDMGILGESQNFWGTPEGGIHFNGGVATRLRKRCAIISAYDTPNNLIAEGKLLPGDICTWTFDYNHTNIYAGNGLWYDAGAVQTVAM